MEPVRFRVQRPWLVYFTDLHPIKFGLRLPLIFGGVWQSIWLFVFAAAGTARDPSTNQGIGKCVSLPFFKFKV